MLQGFLLIEAINSVAIEHARTCDCDVCRAADGDQDALVRIWIAVADDQARREARGA